jgi:AcrR family transcriptional regulator
MENVKKEILDKIGCLFFRYGIKSVSMDDIARELGMSKKTLYIHFKDKRDVVDKVISQDECVMLNNFKERVQRATNAMEECFEIILMVKSRIEDLNPSVEYDLEKYYPDLFKEQKKIKINNMLTFFSANLAKGIEEGVYRNDFDAEILIKFHITTIINIDKGGMFTKAEMYNHEIYRQYFISFMRGIASEKGIYIIENKIEEYGLNNMVISK